MFAPFWTGAFTPVGNLSLVQWPEEQILGDPGTFAFDFPLKGMRFFPV